MASAFAFQPAPPAEVKSLQRALRAAGAKDASGRPPVADGVLGTSTVQAVNDWNNQAHATRMPFLTRAQILANVVGLTNAILANNVAVARKVPRAPAALVAAKVHNADAPRGPLTINGFRCQDGTCKPIDEQAKARALALQRALNQMPADLRVAYPTATGMLPLTGNLGPLTARAYQLVLLASARRLGLAAPAELTTRTGEWLAEQLELAIMDVTRELTAVTAPAQTRVPVVPTRVAAAGALAFTLHRSGSATGNREWKCMAMQLQLQLNRYGQRLKVDGTIGGNTIASFNRVMKQKWTVRDLARNVQDAARQVRLRADAEGMPLPREEAHVLAAEKCAAETVSPIADARYFGAGPVAVPTTPPTPTPTASRDQPLPVVPSPQVRELQGLLAQFPAPIVATFPGGKAPAVTGILSDNDVGAVRAVLRWDFGRQGKPWTEDDARRLTLSSVSGAIAETIATVGMVLAIARGLHAQPAGAPVGVANVGQSRGGLLYQVTPQGVVGYGPNAQAFVAAVTALQEALSRLALGSDGGGDGELGAARHAPVRRRGRIVYRVSGQPFRAARAEVRHHRQRGQRAYAPTPASAAPSVYVHPAALRPLYASDGSDAAVFAPPGAFNLTLLQGLDDDYAPGPIILGAIRGRGRKSAAPPTAAQPQAVVRTPVVLAPSPVPLTGILDAATVGAFNRYVAPTMESAGPFTGAQIASDIESAVQLARNATVRRAPQPTPMSMPQPQAVPIRGSQPAPAPEGAEGGGGGGEGAETPLPMVPPSPNLTIPAAALAPSERTGRPFPILKTVGVVAGAVGALAGAWVAVRQVRRSRHRAEAR